VSFDQNIPLGTPCVVLAKRKRIAMIRRNSPHVSKSERVLFVAWRMVVLNYSSGKIEGRNPTRWCALTDQHLPTRKAGHP
jgi:hypothetical protein